ncbi:MAG: hypothetical protein JW768_11320 [Chitinispirillaceae bacterium]|nr:hypothetical protein [Chitinispirillaceae bacterium]
MPMNTAPVFDGFTGLVKRPLEHPDPRFEPIQDPLQHASDSYNDPFEFLIETLSTVDVSECKARHHWKKILEHKQRMELKLCRALNIKTAIIDYYDQRGGDRSNTNSAHPERVYLESTEGKDEAV